MSRPVVRNLRLLVHGAPDSVADVVPDDAVAVALGQLLDRRPDIADPVAEDRLRDANTQGFLRDADELCRLVGDPADGDGDRGVGVPSLDDRAGVDADDVALAKPALG